jgi:tRNA threonylcarbamoyladenosine biosynthesis protein TsaB
LALLFIDSTYDITLGILNDDFRWIDFKKFSGQKASLILQKEIYNLFCMNQIPIEKISGVLTVAGPGFYTGLRLSEGFSDVYQFFNIPHFSFFSYDIPLWCKYPKGVWLTKAYRGEYFIHQWNETASSNLLINSADLPIALEKVKDPIFIHSESALDSLCLDLIKNPIATHDLLRAQSTDIFGYVLAKKLKENSFYFRAPEDEFKVGQ